MKRKSTTYLSNSLLLLPIILSACGGNNQQYPFTATDNNQAEPPKMNELTISSAKESNSASVAQSAKENDTSSTLKTENSPSATHEETKIKKISNNVKLKDISESSISTISKNNTKTDPLFKTPITNELIEKVHKAKISIDNPGLPNDYQAHYTIITTDKKYNTELPHENKKENYHFDNSIFPIGESHGSMQSTLGGKPHTEETFMSYQQFYSGITGSRKNIIYFGDEPVKRNEPFYIELPTGLLTKVSDLPIAGEATYKGKAIDGERFGNFSYSVNFKEKIGIGGSVKWEKNQPGELKDITLKGAKISPQVLSVYSEPELFPDEYSYRAPGITGIATIDGQKNKKFEYKAVFFGPHAEEFGGLIYERNNIAEKNNLSDEIEQNNIVSFTGQR